MTAQPPPYPFQPAAWQTTPFTEAELTDIRRFCGFPAYAAFGYIFGGTAMANADWQLSQMTNEQQTVVRTIYLVPLYAQEAAVVASGANMGTDVAAVWTRNRTERQDRQAQFDAKRRELCGFIGVSPGPFLNAGGGRVTRC